VIQKSYINGCVTSYGCEGYAPVALWFQIIQLPDADVHGRREMHDSRCKDLNEYDFN